MQGSLSHGGIGWDGWVSYTFYLYFRVVWIRSVKDNDFMATGVLGQTHKVLILVYKGAVFYLQRLTFYNGSNLE